MLIGTGSCRIGDGDVTLWYCTFSPRMYIIQGGYVGSSIMNSCFLYLTEDENADTYASETNGK